jgi:hypothetical protein
MVQREKSQKLNEGEVLKDEYQIFNSRKLFSLNVR